jgi:hypothetical protein
MRAASAGGRGGAVLDEVTAPRLERAQVALVVTGVDAGRLAQPRHRLGPVRAGRFQIAVGAEGGDDPAVPGGVRGERAVRREVVAGVVGGGQDLDAEAPEQGAGPEGVVGEPLGDPVVDPVRAVRARTLGDAEDLGQLRLEPVPDGGAAEDGPVRAQPAPHGPRLGLRQRAAAHAQLRQGHAGGVQQPGHVVVRGDQQARRVGERCVVGQQPGVHVTVRGEDRQLPHALVEPAGERAGPRVGRQQTVGGRQERDGGSWHAVKCGTAGPRAAIGCHELPGVLAVRPPAVVVLPP